MADFYAFYPPSGGTSSNASVGSNGVTAPTSSTEIGGVNPSGNLTPVSVDNAGNVNVNVGSSVLPTGGATAANQVTGNNSLADIDTQVQAINTKTPALGQALAASSTPVVLPAAQITALTPPTTVTVIQPTGTNLHTVVDSSALPSGASTSALQTTGNNSLATIATNTANAGTPVVSGTVTANQGSAGASAWKVDGSSVTQPVSIAAVVSVTDAADGPVTPGAVATKSLLNGIQFNTSLPTLTNGQQAAMQADSNGRVLVGSIASALPAGSNSIGAITTLQLPTTIGIKTSAASTSVVLASDQAAVPIKTSSGTLTDNSGTTSATPSTSTTLMAINSTRKYLLIQNLSTTATIYINFTSAASATASSIALGPLGSFVQESGFVTTEAVTVLATTASVPYMAKQA